MPTCKVDTSQPVGTWDDCAGGFVLRPGELYSIQGADKHLRLDNRFVLARGSPAVLQGIALPTDLEPKPADYEYAGAQPIKLDDRGRARRGGTAQRTQRRRRRRAAPVGREDHTQRHRLGARGRGSFARAAE